MRSIAAPTARAEYRFYGKRSGKTRRQPVKKILARSTPRSGDLDINDQTHLFAKELFKKHAAEVVAATPLLNLDGSAQHRQCAEHRRRDHPQSRKHYAKSRDADGALWGLVGNAVRAVLGVPAKESQERLAVDIPIVYHARTCRDSS
jgi:hypothetical protein